MHVKIAKELFQLFYLKKTRVLLVLKSLKFYHFLKEIY